MARVSEHIEWLNLIDRSGPFLVPAVLEETFPQGLEKVETPRKQRLRNAYEEWRDAIDESDPQLSEIHNAWITMVLQDMLEYENEVLVDRSGLVGKCVYKAPEHGIEIAPDFALRGDDGNFKILISYWPPETDLEKPVSVDSWPSSPLDRMTLLCRANNVRTGLVTDGERWMIVNAPVGGVSGYGAWLARLWWQEPITLKAFQSLLGVRRFFGSPEGTLDSLLERSSAFQEEVTDTLGEQVRRAVEILIQSLGRADQDRNGELLKDVEPKELYEAGLTVMMRLVFTLCAEERGLLLLGDPIYDQYYAISTLRSILREEADRLGVEVLERRHDAWSRLLSMFRAIFGGVEHESLRMPAMGGSLFDPDRFPFLEGRPKGTKWKEHSATPLPIDNRTVLLLLDALQVLEQKGGAQLLSYRALDVEQIGHVYEGLLECTVAKLNEVTIGLIGSQKVRHPSTTLQELEALSSQGTDKIVKHLAELTGRSATTIKKALEKDEDETIFTRLIHACGGDEKLAGQLSPYVNLFDEDSWGTFLVYRAGSFAVVRGSDRRDTGTHYTPRSLAERIVEKTLEPVTYFGPSEGVERANWKLKTPSEILELKVCDPAMGSGAFLVQVCRFLAEKLVEAWVNAEKNGKAIDINGVVLDALDNSEPLPKSLDERIIAARRFIAERCLYGVDKNPLAVELAKLSIWLVTMSKGRPFGFLDHNLRSGDSLLGIIKFDQLVKFSIDPDSKHYQERLFGQKFFETLKSAIEMRKTLRDTPIRDIYDVYDMERLDSNVRKILEDIENVADAIVGETLLSNGDKTYLESSLNSISIKVNELINGNENIKKEIYAHNQKSLAVELPDEKNMRKPFHWPLDFPEVFFRENGGFDAIVGNPPFLGGKRISTVMGPTYNVYLITIHDGANKNADLVAHFFRRAFNLLRRCGCFGLLSTNSIAEGDTRQSGLEWMLRRDASIFAAYPNEPWPGSAAVVTSRVHVYKGKWNGIFRIFKRSVQYISPFLTENEEWSVKPLKANNGIAFQGTIALGMGFVLTNEDAKRMLDDDSNNYDVIFPLLNGEDLNSHPEQKASRWVINFWDWPEEKARNYKLPYQWIRERVYPERLEKSKEKSYRNIMSMWWLHWNVRQGLYHSIGRGHLFEKHPENWNSDQKPFEKVICITRVSKYLNVALIKNNQIFTLDLIVFSMNSYKDFGILQSSIHGAFAWQNASRMKNDLRYSPTDAFEPFPFSRSKDKRLLDTLDNLSFKFYEGRQNFMSHERIGLTKFYNKFHDSHTKDCRIDELRTLFCKIDNTVSQLYDIGGIGLEHDFHKVTYLPEHDRTRFTISESARVKIIKSLFDLNHQRYEEEIKACLHDKKITKKSSATLKNLRINSDSDLFE